jgi:hypothetical protein
MHSGPLTITRLLTVALLLPAVAFAVACGGDSSGGGAAATIDAASGGSVSSDDGRLTLQVPPGALVDDTRISIETLEGDDLPEGAEGDAAYRLEPNGLSFSAPVTATLRVDLEALATRAEDGAREVPLLTVQSDGQEPELAANTAFAVSAEGVATVSGEIEHFSLLQRKKSGLWFSLSTPDDVIPGVDFESGLNLYYFYDNGSLTGLRRESITGEFTGSDEITVVSVNGRPGGSFDGYYAPFDADLICTSLGSHSFRIHSEVSFSAVSRAGADKPHVVSVTFQVGVNCTVVPTATLTPEPFIGTPTQAPFVPTETPTVIVLDETGCRVDVQTNLQGSVDTQDGIRWNVRVDLKVEGRFAVGYDAVVLIDKAGVQSQASGTTADEGRITFSVLQVDPGDYTLDVTEVRDPDGETCSQEPGSTTHAAWTVDAPPPLTGEVSVNCTHLKNSSYITVTGSGFVPGASLPVQVDGPGVVKKPSVVNVDDQGGFSFQVDINIKGNYNVVIDGVTYLVDCN